MLRQAKMRNRGTTMKGKKTRTTRKAPVRQVRETEQGDRPENVVSLEICIARRVAKAGLGFLFMNLSDLFQREV